MLKNIRLHVSDDDEIQAALDKKLAQHILTTQHKNINAFQRNIPSLLPYIKSGNLTTHSLFCNTFGEINIVNYGLGRTLYGFHPEQEIVQDVEAFLSCSPYISLLGANIKQPNFEKHDQQSLLLRDTLGWKKTKQFEPAPKIIDCLIILGCGLGNHILHLMNSSKIKFLIIYEPEIEYFQCSCLATPWDKIFELAKTNGTQLFIQTGKDGRSLINDVEELQSHVDITGFYLYQHYNHPIFDSLTDTLTSHSWDAIKQRGIHFSFNEKYAEFVPIWTPPIDIDAVQDVSTDSKLLKKNLSAFERYFPNIYQQFKTYKPKVWIPVKTANGEINLIKKDSLKAWYSKYPQQDCLLNFENFSQQPHKDGLALGYSGRKLAHYIHYQFVKETEELLKKTEEEVGTLPDTVPSIIMFGLGVGYQLEALLEKHAVEKLFLCEPNPDFFYASLFAIDWQRIFETVEKSESRIYLNIGDDGTNLFRDLLNQFYAIGPYILNSTYFYQSYYNASLNSAISQLREQLQVVISMGEYFDHAYYGIAHTKEGIRRNIPILTANPASKLSYDDKEVPIFIVGNGPSLDSSIEAIKEWQDQAIIVSCGTTLQALHRHGITPDFHAEIEQNRSTYDWAVLIGDLNYLKNITLISCNGIHPDTCELYKDVMIAFKEGESSTVSALNMLGLENYNVLQNAFPTVSNFACDIFSSIGFTSIYLIGVDLGFVDVKHHHSKSSGYYQEDGEETYDYSDSANTSLIVPGNFRPKVNTKHEFKVSRQVIEQVTRAKPKGQDFYNCSDGAKIEGTLPLSVDELLIVTNHQQKILAIDKLKTVIFSDDKLADFAQKFEQAYSLPLLIKELNAFETLLETDVTCKDDVEKIINKQKEMLFASYSSGQSLLFYYLYGSVNFANAAFTKLLYTSGKDLQSLIEAINKWLLTIRSIKTLISNKYNLKNYDYSGFKIHDREELIFPRKTQNCTLLLVSSSHEFKQCASWVLDNYFPHIKNYKIVDQTGPIDPSASFDYVIYYEYDKEKVVTGLHQTLLISSSCDITAIKHSDFSIYSIPRHTSEKILNTLTSNIYWAIRACLCIKTQAFIIPKLISSDPLLFNEDNAYKIPDGYLACDFQHFICVYYYQNVELVSSTSGTRGQMIFGDIKNSDVLLSIKTDKDLDKLKEVHKTAISESSLAKQ